jgi:hypothetical protein
MKGPSEKGKAQTTGRKTAVAGMGESGIDLERAASRTIRVQCPNPACRRVHVVDRRLARRKGRCPCGTLIPIPAVGASPPAAAPRAKGERGRATVLRGQTPERKAPAEHEPTPLTEVRIGCIGRGQAGKTVLFRCLAEHLVGDFFPSGLHADAGDPREVARMIHENEETRRLLRRCGLPPTEHATQTSCYLYEGDEPRVVYRMREVIGQILTHTLPDSAAPLQARYGEYLKALVNTHVLWVMVPCPPADPTPADRRRYANDLRITLAYLREALRLRSKKHPVAVALVLSKIDTLFADAAAAQAALADEVLLDALGPLVTLIERSKRVSEAVIAPVTAFGFGNAVLREAGDGPEGERSRPTDGHLGAEPVWLLREGANPEPFNVNALFLWTLLAGLVHAAGPHVLEERSNLGALCRTLRGDLEGVDPWLVTVKGGPV